MTTIADAAAAAGLTDPDLLKLAKPGLSADSAVADLRQRYPAAFPCAKKYRDMTAAERTAFDRQHRVRVRAV